MDDHAIGVHHAAHAAHHTNYHSSPFGGNQDEIYGRMQAMSALQLARDDSIYVLKAKGADSQFGCIGCKGSSITCNANPHFLPDELNGIVSFAEFSAMTREVIHSPTSIFLHAFTL